MIQEDFPFEIVDHIPRPCLKFHFWCTKEMMSDQCLWLQQLGSQSACAAIGSSNGIVRSLPSSHSSGKWWYYLPLQLRIEVPALQESQPTVHSLPSSHSSWHGAQNGVPPDHAFSLIISQIATRRGGKQIQVPGASLRNQEPKLPYNNRERAQRDRPFSLRALSHTSQHSKEEIPSSRWSSNQEPKRLICHRKAH